MKSIIFILSLTIFCSVKTCFGQSFYEVKWTGNDAVNYKGFLIYNSDNDALMRVAFTVNGVYKVAEYKVTSKYFTTADGINYYLMNGENAIFVFNGNYQGYSADKFLFADLDSQHHFKNLYAYDENDLAKSNLAELMRPATWRALDPKADFTEPYIHEFYGTYEHNYTALVSMINTPKEYNSTSSNAKLYLVIVANTLDNSIGTGCEVDRRKLVNEMNSIARSLNISVEEHDVYGTDFGKDNVLNAIDALHPSSDDIVMFFYRGHGFRWNDQKSAWPDMSTRISSYDPFTYVSLDDVYTKIVSKGARLNLVFGDLCNSNVGIDKPEVTNQGTNSLQSNFYPDAEKLKKLFLYSKGNVMSVAASPGEVSWTSAYDGGFFTSSFFESLHAEIGALSGSGSWKNIIISTINKAKYKSQYGCSTCSVQNGEYYLSPELGDQ